MHRLLRQEDPAAPGWPRGYVVAQPPNATLLVAAAAWVLSKLLDGGGQAVATAAFYLALGVWAADELRHGANGVRRLLGLVVLVLVLVRLGDAFDRA